MSQNSEEIDPEGEWKTILGETCTYPMRAGILEYVMKFYVEEEIFREFVRKVQTLFSKEFRSRKLDNVEISHEVFERFWFLLKENSIKYKIIGEVRRVL